MVDWLVLGVPALLLTIDLLLALSGNGFVQTRRAALVLLGFLAAGNFGALAILVAGLVSTNASELTGGELLLTGFAIFSTNMLVFGLIFWEVEDGGPVARLRADEREPGFRFPQDDDRAAGWNPQVWDYLYVSLTNSIAFSPTDTMPLSFRARP